MLLLFHTLDEIRERLEASNDKANEQIPTLDLTTKKEPSILDDPALCQFRDSLAWELPDGPRQTWIMALNTQSYSLGTPDAGQAIFLRKYVPIDMLQIPIKANTREQAVKAISTCDRYALSE